MPGHCTSGRAPLSHDFMLATSVWDTWPFSPKPIYPFCFSCLLASSLKTFLNPFMTPHLVPSLRSYPVLLLLLHFSSLPSVLCHPLPDSLEYQLWGNIRPLLKALFGNLTTISHGSLQTHSMKKRGIEFLPVCYFP